MKPEKEALPFAFVTDGFDAELSVMGLTVLRDKLGVLPPYDAMLLGRPGLCRDKPKVCETLAELEGQIDLARMQALNGSVDQDHRDPSQVARAFLTEVVRSGLD